MDMYLKKRAKAAKKSKAKKKGKKPARRDVTHVFGANKNTRNLMKKVK